MISGLTKSRCRKALCPHGRFVHVEMARKDDAQDLAFLRELIEAGKIETFIDRCFPFEEIPAAHRYVEEGRKQGHIVIVGPHDGSA
jgi:NADPH:quinone reductase-like Zn-dependent oxidoreductase